VTISGIGDNFQLHTLLAASLIGEESRGMIPGQPPTPAEIAAASDGEVTPPDGIMGISTSLTLTARGSGTRAGRPTFPAWREPGSS
jgi:hypothetical protein